MTSIAHTLTQTELLQQRFTQLQESGAQNFDPLRFRFLESLWQRSGNHRINVRKILLDKFQLALDSYISDYEEYRCRAEQNLRSLASHPKVERLQDLFQRGNYKAVVQQSKLLTTANRSDATQTLASLTQQLYNMPLTKAEPEQSNPFDNLLLQQDQETIAKLREGNNDPAPSSQQSLRRLAAGRHLQTLIRKHHEETLISQALLHAPEDPGPLNAHKLLLSALTTLRELSPKYISRFAAYGENLLWLEEMDRRESIGTKSKTKS